MLFFTTSSADRCMKNDARSIGATSRGFRLLAGVGGVEADDISVENQQRNKNMILSKMIL